MRPNYNLTIFFLQVVLRQLTDTALTIIKTRLSSGCNVKFQLAKY